MMNELIKELIKRAGTDCSGKWMSSDHVSKFAELIIDECVKVINDNTPIPDEDITIEDWDKGYIRAMSDCVHHIQEHFGVEE